MRFFDDSIAVADMPSLAIERVVSPHPGPLPTGEGEPNDAAWSLVALDFKNRVYTTSLSLGRGLG